MNFWVHNIDPIAFTIFSLPIRWYALSYILAFSFASLYMIRAGKHWSKFKLDHLADDVMCYGALGAIVFGRLGHVIFYHPIFFLQNPSEIFKIWHGGMSFHGGLLGVIIATKLVAVKYKLKYFELMDIFAPAAAFGIGFGRLANFANGELYGVVTNKPWAVIFDDGLPRHPTQIYEAITEGFLLFFILDYLLYKTKLRLKTGFISATFACLYGTLRFMVEILKEPDLASGYILHCFTMGQVLCMPMILFGLLTMVYIMKEDFRSFWLSSQRWKHD